jgi:predicted aspartyl protease
MPRTLRSRPVGIFTTTVAVGNLVERQRVRKVARVLVDSGAEYTWIAAATLDRIGVAREKTERFRLANGTLIRRSIGFVFIYVGKRFTTDEVAFAEPGDIEILGSRSLEGLGLMPDPCNKRLVPSGPIITASVA